MRGKEIGDTVAKPKGCPLRNVLRLFTKISKAILSQESVLALSIPVSLFRHYPNGSLGLVLGQADYLRILQALEFFNKLFVE